MKISDMPPIQGKRFDFETLQYNAISLMKLAEAGPTFLRHAGRITLVVMTEELFDELWPDPRRALSTSEMPLRMERLLREAVDRSLAKSEGDDT